MIGSLQINSDFWREMADFRSKTERSIFTLVQLENKSTFSLTSTHLELTCIGPSAKALELSRAEHMPERPESNYYLHTNLQNHSDEMYFDDRGTIPTMHFNLGTVRPGQIVNAFDELVLLPSKPGRQLIKSCLYANEIEFPIRFEREIDISGETIEVSEGELYTQYQSY